MAKIHYTRKAVDDLSSIWNYTASVWSEKQADEYYNQLIDSIQKLATNRLLISKRYPHISENLFGYKSGKHIIFYKKSPNDEIIIVRILHGSMDMPRRIKD